MFYQTRRDRLAGNLRFRGAAARRPTTVTFRPCLEGLENRVVLSTILVGPSRAFTTISDGIAAAAPGGSGT